MGRIAAVVLIGLGLAGGAAAYYFQVYAFYDRLEPRESFALTPMGAAAPQPVPISGFEGIDSDSSPLRFRACFTLQASVDAYAPHPAPTPLIAPGWFDCFDAEAIGADLERGAARALMAEAHFEYGFDRVVAVYPDGRAYAWHQINPCGESFFDGLPLPPDCPLPPEGR